MATYQIKQHAKPENNMKKLVLTSLMLISFIAAAPVGARQKPASKNALSKAFKEENSDADNQGANFALSVAHDGTAQYTSSGSIKTLQIFPLNTATGIFTYDFS